MAFKTYKQVWNVKNHRSKVRKKDLASWVSLTFNKALISMNIKIGFRGVGIWPLNFEVMKNKMDPNEQFVLQSAFEVRIEK